MVAGGTPGVRTPIGVARRADEGRRIRLLTALCLTTAGAHLVVITVQTALHRMQVGPLAIRLAMDLVLLSAPMVRRWTGSVRIAALLVGVAVAVALPLIALQSGALSAPMMVVVPLVPMLMATFVGRSGTLFMGAALFAGLVVVAAVGAATDVRGDPTIRFTILAACLSIAVLTAYLHERERDSMESDLRAAAVALKEESLRDSLTKLSNRRHLDDRLAEEIAFARRHGTDLSVIMVDVDHFKSVNDRYGHSAGDEVLRAIASRLRASVRTEDTVARFGGEEFAVVLRATDLAASRIAAERIRQIISASPVDLLSGAIPVTISAGCASLASSRSDSASALMAAADGRLYAAKQAGRNRVKSSDPASSPAP